MRGSEQIRFCDHCARDVHNLSEMTRKRARKVVAESGGGICVRYVRRPDGRIQTVKNTLHQITRQTGIAAGILGTSLSVSTVAYAQGEINLIKDLPEKIETVEAAKERISEPKEIKTATVSGTVTDPNGAVIPNAAAILSNEKTGDSRTTTANDEGFYKFENVAAGTYRLNVSSLGFKPKEINSLAVENGSDVKNDVLFELDANSVTVGFLIAADYQHALFTAVSDDNLEAVKTLIAKGENVNARDKNYNSITALFIAVENGSVEIAETLLNAGAKVNVRDNEKRTPLMNLDEDASAELVNLLLRHGAKIDSTDKKQNTVLILAAAYTNKDVVQALISADANVNAVNKQGETALMNAAENGETEIVRLLLASGADANARNRDGRTALGLARTDEARQYLVAYGAR